MAVRWSHPHYNRRQRTINGIMDHADLLENRPGLSIKKIIFFQENIPSDFYLFPNLTNFLAGQRFGTNGQIFIANGDDVFIIIHRNIHPTLVFTYVVKCVALAVYVAKKNRIKSNNNAK